ncbi:TetR/AcrR family transcriptional regulator [Mesobacillus foraminis]|uniref:TetR/AcrR family transcriptional regulator n=1 Tax=Mesobacillus foraminis TaxID=279826 RepID=UPI000EF4F998|nr:TetR/AcrR family transcriptional regulator [Mesobacillus foraminis]
MSWLKRRAQKELTKKKIFEASLSLFIEKGYENVSIEQIVASLGLTKGAFYHHFVSKDAIIIEFYHTIIQELTEELLFKVRDLREQESLIILESIFHQISLFCVGKFKFLKILLSPSVNSKAALEDVFINEISIVLFNILQIGESREEYQLYRPSKDSARYMAALLFYEVRYLCMSEEIQHDKKSISRSLEDILQVVSNGLFITK